MTAKEEISLQNDLNKLKNNFNSSYVSIYKRPDQTNILYRLKFVVNAPSFVAKRNKPGPIPTNKVSFYMDILPGYPKTKPVVYYGDEEWLYHVNVFTSVGHNQCTDQYDPDSSDIVELAEKTVRAIVFDPAVTRFNSMANSIPKSWQQAREDTHMFPTINPALLMRRSSRRTPSSI